MDYLTSDLCKECDTLHPRTPPGQCPVALARKQSSSEQGKQVNEFITNLATHLHSSPNWKKEIEDMKRCIIRTPKK